MQRARSLALLAARGSRSYRNPVELDPFNKARSVMPLGLDVPTVAVDAWVAPCATVVGSVGIADRASVWYGAVVRGDLASVSVGAFSSVGDRAVVSTARCVVARVNPSAAHGSLTRVPASPGACRPA